MAPAMQQGSSSTTRSRPGQTAVPATTAHPDGGIAEASLRIGGMHCAACAHAVERTLHAVPGLLAVQVSAASGLGSVRWSRRETT